MRLAWLFLRSRLVGPVVGGIALLVVLAMLWERWFGHQAEAMTAALVLFPLAIGCIVGAGSHSPFGETEQTASLSLPLVRSVHLAGLTALGALGLLLVAATWPLDADTGTLLRNLAGLTGLALLSAPLVGGRLSWIAPVAMAMVAQLLDLNGVPSWSALTWPAASFGNGRALIAALVLLAGGLAAVYVIGPRVASDDAPA